LELQGLAAGSRSRLLLAALAAALLLALPAQASAASATKKVVKTVTTVKAVTAVKTVTATSSNVPVLVTNPNRPPLGDRLTAREVERIAAASPVIRAELKRHPRAIPYEYTKGIGSWQVSWFSRGRHQVELAQVYVDDSTGKVTQAWTGYQVAWSMARGYAGAFGRRVNAWYVWIPLCLLFVAPFVPWRSRRPTLLHLDLLVLLGFSISLALFNHAQIGLSVPLIYPFLLYLLVRMLLLAFGRGRPRAPLRLAVPVSWLAVGVIFLVGFRVGLNVTNSNVIDVGYAGVIGADKLIHNQPLYGHWPPDNAEGDTYGPVAYFAYVPFRAIFGWSGTWDSLPAAHAAAITFDLLTLLLLFLIGREVRGPTLGVILAYAWAADPFTLWTLSSNTNDALVSLLLLACLLVLRSAPGRGVGGALAGLTKFAPFVLAPLLLRGTSERWPRRREIVVFCVAFAATVVVAMLPVVLHHDLKAFWDDSISYQGHRVTPFSIWGLWGGSWGGLHVVQRLLEGAAIGLAIAVAFVPRRRGVIEVAALAGALIIALQLVANYWLYSYVVWFLPMVLVALFGSYPGEPVRERREERHQLDIRRVQHPDVETVAASP
jgi:hypothetical protein